MKLRYLVGEDYKYTSEDVEALREVVEFYADPENWSLTTVGYGDRAQISMGDDTDEPYGPAGARARAVLADLEPTREEYAERLDKFLKKTDRLMPMEKTDA
jgi:hypothetical protein